MAEFLKDTAEFVCIIMAIAVVIHIACYVGWRVNRDDSAPRMSYKNFLNLYKAFPDRWKLYDTLDDTFLYYDDVTIEDSYSSKKYKKIEFEKYSDVLKTKWFFHKKRKEKQEEERDKNQEELCKMLLRDITKLQAENAREIHEALERSKQHEETGNTDTGTGDDLVTAENASCESDTCTDNQ